MTNTDRANFWIKYCIISLQYRTWITLKKQQSWLAVWKQRNWIGRKYEGWNFNSGNYLFTIDTK